MKKACIVIMFILTSCLYIGKNGMAATNEFVIKQYEENREVVFEPIDVLPGSIEEQIIVLKNNTGIQKYDGAMGYLTEDAEPNDYKRTLPHQRYINPNVHIVYEIAYSQSNRHIILIRRVMNFHPTDSVIMKEKTVTVDWYLLKNRKINQ
ncbi:MAG: hypothetical protein BroJett002_37380 [Candidatus Brocadia sinica]|nr:MAG: hypothetical protein BroJett002_37380 [Candidatus Brocadia sinica]